jgi:hypothetical protein
MWRHADGRRVAPSRSVFANMYASLGDRQRFGGDVSGCEAEIDVLAKQLNLSPQAETALRKGRKDSKAKNVLKGGRDPLMFLQHVSARQRRASYA